MIINDFNYPNTFESEKEGYIDNRILKEYLLISKENINIFSNFNFYLHNTVRILMVGIQRVV